MLEKLCTLCGASGYENEVVEFITKKLEEEDIPYFVDKTGNIIVRQGENPDCIGIFAHTDEVGFGVKGITESGMIKFEAIGGILEKILPSHAVVIGKEAGKRINGVIGNMPTHLKKNEKGKSELSYSDFFIDIGAKSKEEASKYVKIGDPVYWISKYQEFGDGLIKAKALDDRAGVCILLSLVLSKKYSFTAVFTTREELGIIGAKTVLKNQNLRIKNALVLEVTTCADMPEVDIKTTLLGEGVAISIMDRGSVSDGGFNEEIIKIAKKNKIPFQKKLTLSGGNDAGAITYYGGGIPTSVLSIPGRYIHSPVTVISKNDFDASKKLCEKILEERNAN